MQPAIIFQLLPILGFLLCISSFSYLWLMRSKHSDMLIVVYMFEFLDFLMAISLFYAGFHGLAVIANADENTMIKPIDCFMAIHISIWCVLDVVSAFVFLILCFDQIISIIWTKAHKSICRIYMQPFVMVLLFFLSFGILKPAWSYAIENDKNNTVLISPFCSMPTVFHENFYELDLAIRMITPLIALLLLFLAAILLLCYQLAQEWQFKWSDNNGESVRRFYYAVMRSVFAVLTTYLPIWFFFRSKLKCINEIYLRMFYAGTMGLTQPLLMFRLFPDYLSELKKFFSRYSHNTKRTWQSADDPPVQNKSDVDSDLNFGSWYSSAGNIIGECGVPAEIPYQPNDKKQRSISFYCT